MVCTGTKIKNFFIFVLVPKPFLKFSDKLIGKGCPTTGVLSMWNEIHRIASLHLVETLRPTALPHDSALHLYITCKLLLSVRLAPVVTVAAGTTWGDATPCYASHHMMLVLLYEYGRMVCTGTKIKNFFIVVLIPKPFLKFPDKLIGKGCLTTGVLSMWNEKQRIASLHLVETLRPTALPHDSALHL